MHDERIKRCSWPKKKYRHFENSVKRTMNNEDVCNEIVSRTIKAIHFFFFVHRCQGMMKVKSETQMKQEKFLIH